MKEGKGFLLKKYEAWKKDLLLTMYEAGERFPPGEV
jgi:hypothetical protein